MPFLTLSNNPEKRQRQVERGQAVDRENERRMNVQELFDAINMIRAQENTVVRRKPESQGDIPRYASPRSEPRHEMREAPLPSYTDTLGALKYNLSPTLGVAQLVALPALVYDLGETAVDALRGTNSPSRFRQVANALSKGMGGPSMPNTAAEWRGELAGSLLNPANFVSAVGSPLRMLRSVPAALRHGAEGFAQAVPVSNVIKNKGGNWLSGSVEGALRGLKKEIVGQDPVKRAEMVRREIDQLGAGIDPKTGVDLDVVRGHYQRELDRMLPGAAINNFIDKQLTRYVKNEMATPEDPIRALAERGVLHFTPDWVPEGSLARGQAAALTGGKAGQRLGQTRLGQDWEDLTDQGVNQASRSELSNAQHVANPWLTKLTPETPVYEMPRDMEQSLGFNHLIDELANALNPESGLPRHLLLDPKSMDRVSVPQAVERVAAINAWRAAQKAEADALRANNAATRLHKEYPVAEYWHGGDYVPGSDLTRPLYVAKNKSLAESYVGMSKDRTGEGLLVPLSHSAKSPAPEDIVVEEARKLGIDVDNYTPASIFDSELHGEGVVSALVRRLKAKGYDSANLHDIGYGEQVDDVATVLFPGVKTNKGYDNPMGLRWVELKQNDELPEGLVYRPETGVIDTRTGNPISDPRTQALADALKYEGDTMGHCVGGYCDDVLQGRSRIFSLRDAKGQPHVTIETAPPRDAYPVSGEAFAMLPQETKDQYRAITADWRTRNPDDPDVWKALAEAGIEPTPPSIIQIKGKQNRKPNDEYLPFVQDFVKSGKWRDVGDLQNTGLTLHPSGRYVSDAEAAALAERHFGGKWGNKPDADENPFQYFNRINRYSDDMLSDADKAFIADWKAGNFASGGHVKNSLPDFTNPANPGLLNYYRSIPRVLESTVEGVPSFRMEKAHGGSVQKFAGGGLALLRKALTGQLARDMGTTSVIKNKGGNWLSGSVEGALSRLKKREGIVGSPEWAQAEDELGPKAINTWIDKQLTRYVKNDMATPEDPVRALAERGVLHVEPGSLRYGTRPIHPSGDDLTKLAVSDAAKRWENASDYALGNETAGLYKTTRGQDGSTTLSRNPWLEKLPNDAKVYDLGASYANDNLGFNHLIDELSNALNPESGLPRHLLLDPKSMDRVSVPQAVERVAKINEWRKALKVEEDLKRANNAATVLHKEYPEKGMKWVELKSTGNVGIPEGYTVEPNSTYLGKTGYQLRRPNGDRIGIPQPTEEAAFAQLNESGFKTDKALEDALKYEGDTMGHCVGGYCDDVASGRSRIFSLRDEKGQPHVTIEVSPQPRNQGQQDIPDRYIDEAMERMGIDSPEAQWGREEEIDKLAGDLWRKDNPDTQRIVQIKGKQNRAPNPEYLPFVQDFVKSGQWSGVGDLGNSGLKRLSDFGDEPMIQKAREKFGEYVTPQEWDAIMSGKEGFAHGGTVQQTKPFTVQDLQAIIQTLRQEPLNA